MKRVMIFVIGLLLLLNINNGFASAETPHKVMVVAVSVSLYETANLENPLKESGENVKAVHGEVFTVISEQGDFFEVQYKATSAFVLKAYVIDVNTSSKNVKLDTNAVLKEESEVWENKGSNFTKVGITLEKGTKVKLLDGYNSELSHTRISFEYNEETLTYYVETEHVAPEGMSASGITAIALIVTCTSIILILFGFKGKKKRKKEK